MRPYHSSKKPKHAIPTHNDSNDDDYMSMDFILNAQSFDDTRNSAVNQRRKPSNKRKLPKDSTKHRFEPKTKKLRVRMEEQRNKGLSKAIEEDNIGFKLLQKMGYKTGMIIGKNQTNENEETNHRSIALKEPIKIQIRDKNSGVGIHEMKERKIDTIQKLIKIQKAQRNDLFAQSIRRKSQKRQYIKEIKQCTIICENLDTQNDTNLKNPIWYKSKEENGNEESKEDTDIDELETLTFVECQNKLSHIVLYLRETHFYCFWCGIKYKDTNTMNDTCPGNDKSLHDSLTDF